MFCATEGSTFFISMRVQTADPSLPHPSNGKNGRRRGPGSLRMTPLENSFSSLIRLFARFQLQRVDHFGSGSASLEISGALVLQVASSSVFPLLRNMTRQWSPSGSRNLALAFCRVPFSGLPRPLLGAVCMYRLRKSRASSGPVVLVLLEGGDDHRCGFRGSFDLEIVVGLPQRPEGGTAMLTCPRGTV